MLLTFTKELMFCLVEQMASRRNLKSIVHECGVLNISAIGTNQPAFESKKSHLDKRTIHRPGRVLKNSLFGQDVQKRPDARRARTEERGVYRNTSSDEVCSATQQRCVFQQPARSICKKRLSIQSMREKEESACLSH